jgi:hypothetical protein
MDFFHPEEKYKISHSKILHKKDIINFNKIEKKL